MFIQCNWETLHNNNFTPTKTNKTADLHPSQSEWIKTKILVSRANCKQIFGIQNIGRLVGIFCLSFFLILIWNFTSVSIVFKFSNSKICIVNAREWLSERVSDLPEWIEFLADMLCTIQRTTNIFQVEYKRNNSKSNNYLNGNTTTTILFDDG